METKIGETKVKLPKVRIDCAKLMLLIFLKALDLQPQDTSGLADPYLVVHMGKTKISDKDNYVPNNLNPLFGK